jgi:F0F1-type ATP synthase membrane subunit c/vacuolar-type H+-ATPase subunit K
MKRTLIAATLFLALGALGVGLVFGSAGQARAASLAESRLSTPSDGDGGGW